MYEILRTSAGAKMGTESEKVPRPSAATLGFKSPILQRLQMVSHRIVMMGFGHSILGNI